MQAYSNACEKNKAPILAVLKTAFKSSKHVLEIGSGTGQHAVFFAEHLPHLHWQTSDVAQNHTGINEWINAFPSANLKRPLALDLSEPQWPNGAYDAVFTANTFHIISKPLVEAFFKRVAEYLTTDGTLCIYGPFNYQGQFTSESNQAFDLWLKVKSATSGIRDFEWVIELAENEGLFLVDDHTMPANNRLLEFIKR